MRVSDRVVHLGDCFAGLRTLADDSVDVTITDPPYSEHVDAGYATMGKHMAGKTNGRGKQQLVRHRSIGIGVMDDAKIETLASELARTTRRWILIFCAFEQLSTYKAMLESAGARYLRCCAWEKPDSTPQLSGDRPATWGECFVVAHAAHDGAMSWNGRGKRGLYRAGVCRGAERSDHPTQKPLDLMLDLVRDFSDPGEIILDPFAGSGTTGVACKMLGRRFVGWELDPTYHAIATRRIAGDEAKPRAEQPAFDFTARTP